ncbi:MAG TPA: hypothetical protein VK009_19330 [Chloroflexota bacterium]|nr:hypothetical protein [Chloroflexota bacterium]
MLNTAARPIEVEEPTFGITERAERIAGRIDVATEEVERLPFDLSAIADEGVFINVDARGFSMLDRRLSWQSLGVTLPRGTAIAFRPPRSGLLPDRYRLALLRPAGRVHAALHKYSYRFTITETLFETPAYRWVPWCAFEAFEAEFNAALKALEAAKQDIDDHYEEASEEVIAAFLQLASDSARRLEATGQPVPDGFEDAVVHGVRKAIPTRDDLQQRLTLRYRVGAVLLGSEMLAEQRRASEERRRLQEVEGAARLERQQQDARERLVQEGLWAEQQRLRQQLEAEQEELRREAAIKERLRNLKIEAAKERLKESLSPLEEGAQQLHAAIYESAQVIRASLEKHGTLTGAAVSHAKKTARWFRLMNWNDSDGNLRALISDLEKLAKLPSEQRKSLEGPLNRVVGDIIQACYADARALAQPQRLSALEL